MSDASRAERLWGEACRPNEASHSLGLQFEFPLRIGLDSEEGLDFRGACSLRSCELFCARPYSLTDRESSHGGRRGRLGALLVDPLIGPSKESELELDHRPLVAERTVSARSAGGRCSFGLVRAWKLWSLSFTC